MNLTQSCRYLLDRYSGPHKKSFETLWAFHEGQGTLDEVLLRDLTAGDVAVEAFTDGVSRLDSDSMHAVFAELDSSPDMGAMLERDVASLPKAESLDPAAPLAAPEFTRAELSKLIGSPGYQTDKALQQRVSEGFQKIIESEAPHGDRGNTGAAIGPSSGRTLHPADAGLEAEGNTLSQSNE